MSIPVYLDNGSVRSFRSHSQLQLPPVSARTPSAQDIRRASLSQNTVGHWKPPVRAITPDAQTQINWVEATPRSASVPLSCTFPRPRSVASNGTEFDVDEAGQQEYDDEDEQKQERMATLAVEQDVPFDFRDDGRWSGKTHTQSLPPDFSSPDTISREFAMRSSPSEATVGESNELEPLHHVRPKSSKYSHTVSPRLQQSKPEVIVFSPAWQASSWSPSVAPLGSAPVSALSSPTRQAERPLQSPGHRPSAPVVNFMRWLLRIAVLLLSITIAAFLSLTVYLFNMTPSSWPQGSNTLPVSLLLAVALASVFTSLLITTIAPGGIRLPKKRGDLAAILHGLVFTILWLVALAKSKMYISAPGGIRNWSCSQPNVTLFGTLQYGAICRYQAIAENITIATLILEILLLLVFVLDLASINRVEHREELESMQEASKPTEFQSPQMQQYHT